MNRSQHPDDPDVARQASLAGRIALLSVNLAGLLVILIWTLALEETGSFELSFRISYLFSVVFLLLLRPVLSGRTDLNVTWIVTDSVALLAANSAVLLLVSMSGMGWPPSVPALIILMASAVLGTVGAILARSGSSAKRTYLTATLLVSALPLAAWLGFAEVARARIDWLLVVSPVGAAAASVMPVAASGVAQAGAVWMTLLAVLSLAWVVIAEVRKSNRSSGGGSGVRRTGLTALLVAGFLLVSVGAAQAELSARLELGVNGTIIAGAWNPARLAIEDLAQPMLVTLSVDGGIHHHVEVKPGKATEFMVFIPAEQPVFSLRPVVTRGDIGPSSVAVSSLRTISAEHWPGMVVTGPRPQSPDLRPLIERAPGCKFLEVELTGIKRLPSSYLAQFPVVMLQTADVQGLPRDQFVRLTEWVASRTLVIDPKSKVRRDWPGLADLNFQRLHGYDVLSPELLELLYRPRRRLIDPDVYFFGSGADWGHRLRRTVLLAACTLLVVGTGFYLLFQTYVESPMLVGLTAVIVFAGLLLAGLWAASALKSKPVITTLILQEGVPDSPVVLETRLRQISAAPGRMCEVTDDTPVGWVPAYVGESQRRANGFSVSGFADGVSPNIWVSLVQGPQVLVGVSTRLAAFPLRDDGLLLQVIGADWTVLRSREGDAELSNVPVEGVGRHLRRRTEGILDERFLSWWSKRRGAVGRWRMHVSVEADPSVGGRTVRVFASPLR